MKLAPRTTGFFGDEPTQAFTRAPILLREKIEQRLHLGGISFLLGVDEIDRRLEAGKHPLFAIEEIEFVFFHFCAPESETHETAVGGQVPN